MPAFSHKVAQCEDAKSRALEDAERRTNAALAAAAEAEEAAKAALFGQAPKTPSLLMLSRSLEQTLHEQDTTDMDAPHVSSGHSRRGQMPPGFFYFLLMLTRCAAVTRTLMMKSPAIPPTSLSTRHAADGASVQVPVLRALQGCADLLLDDPGTRHILLGL